MKNMDSAYTLLFILQSSTFPNKATRLFKTLYLETEKKPIWIISQMKPLFGFGIIHQTNKGLVVSIDLFHTHFVHFRTMESVTMCLSFLQVTS